MKIVLPVANATIAALARVSAAFNAPLGGAVVFGIHIDGLLIAAIVFQLYRKSYKPPNKPLVEREIDELCDEWEPEPPCHPSRRECGWIHLCWNGWSATVFFNNNVVLPN